MQIFILLYADDIILMSNCPNDLQSQINVIQKYFESADLQVNLGKTKTMIINSGNQPITNFYWNGEFIEQKSNSALTQLMQTVADSRVKDIDISRRLFDALVTSIPMYAFPIWGMKFVDKLEKLQTRCLRWLTGSSTYTPGHILRLETGWVSTKLIICKSILTTICNVALKPSSTEEAKSCLKFLIREENHDHVINQWKHFFEEYNLSADFMDLIQDYTIKRHNDIIGKYAQALLNDDVSRMITINYNNIAEIKSHAIKDQIYTSNLSWPMKRFWQNMRLQEPRVWTGRKCTNLGEMYNKWNRHRNKPAQNCKCGHRVEDLFHVMIECNIYNTIRNSEIKVIKLNSITRSNFHHLFYKPDHINEFYTYWKLAMEQRDKPHY
ncbi:unnamed protein product [Allacma fusca]|uniref:Reverse transcriptase domain-containing protein n=1 Tax=Allacma fusca TaxID=39272 RepID=A0A8J2JW51_9HEXA|nr:unnamed protein product [Allacma fusca]